MRRRVIVLDEAEDELAEAPLAASPVAHVPVSLGARKILVKRLPYGIVFMEHDEELWVLAFTHHHRRPGYWRDRMER